MSFTKLLEQTIGWPGRMISGSKSFYIENHRDHFVIFNANLCTKESGKIWFGDLDLTLDKDKLSTLASELNRDLYVLRELDARFENEENPRLTEAIVVFKADGTWQVGENSVYSLLLDPEKLTRKTND